MRSLYWLFSLLVITSSVLLPACFSKSKNGTVSYDGGLPDVLAPGVSIGDGGTRRFTVGGTVDGLRGTGLVLVGDKIEPVTVSPGVNGASVSFTFQTAVPSGFPYDIVIQTQPTNPSQKCTIMAGSGKVGTANVHNIVVNCSTDTFIVGGNVAGVEGNLILDDNGGDSITVDTNGSFAFPTAIPSGGSYKVTVAGNPQFPAETCTVSGGSGTVGTGNITTVSVSCFPNVYTVGGMVTGLTSTGLVLTDNGTDNLPVSASGMFTFASPVTSGSMFTVTITTQPSGQICTPSGAIGEVASSNVMSVVINCTPNTFTVGGQVTNLSGAGLVLQDSTGTLSVGADGSFAFPTPQANGSAYDVQVASQPSNPSQTCTVTGGSGSIAGANVNTVQVSCATASFTVGGQVSGLLPETSVVLTDNGGDSVTVDGNTGFVFPTALSSGAGYNVAAAPSASSGSSSGASAEQQCAVTNGNGVVGTANVDNVVVACNPVYTITVEVNASDLGGDTLTLGDGVDTVAVNGSVPTTVTFQTALPPGTYTVTSSVSGSCAQLSCGFSEDTVKRSAGVHVDSETLTSSTSVTLGPDATVTLECIGDLSCCDNPCADDTCAAYCSPQCGNGSSCTCNPEGC
ncbi:MAG: hypothetical protein ACLP1X_19510 [Polyangiaceae bacterium]